jgi:hypothetical protein
MLRMLTLGMSHYMSMNEEYHMCCCQFSIVECSYKFGGEIVLFNHMIIFSKWVITQKPPNMYVLEINLQDYVFQHKWAKPHTT